MKLIRGSTIQACILDPLPATIMRSCYSGLVPVFETVINLSLSTGSMPEDLEIASLRPLLKKANADFEQFSNFKEEDRYVLRYMRRDMDSGAPLRIMQMVTLLFGAKPCPFLVIATARYHAKIKKNKKKFRQAAQLKTTSTLKVWSGDKPDDISFALAHPMLADCFWKWSSQECVTKLTAYQKWAQTTFCFTS